MRPTEGAVALAVALLAGPVLASGELELASEGRYAMGSILEISLVGGASNAERFDRMYAEVARLESLASRHDETSALATLNRGERPARLAPDLASLLRHSQQWRERSGGAFDISVGPWVELWIAAAKRGRLPDAAERRAARAATGASAFSIDAAGRLELRAGARLDLGAIAKGYALDALVAALREEGAGAPGAALFNFGQSSYWAVGAPPDAEAWRLLLRRPGGGYAGTIGLRDQALSISASLGDSSEIEGTRYGHIIDPRSGEPILRDAQVAVLAPDATAAEALSTAVLVMGAEEGLAWVETLRGCEALWLEASIEVATSGWLAATRYEPAQ